MSTMSRAVASMRAVGEGFGKPWKGSATPTSSSQDEEGGHSRQQTSKMSSSKIADSVTREDPSTKYELLHELGKGSYGSVYKARDIKTSEMVAIKVISLSEWEEGYEEIRGEIDMLQQCSHPNIVRYLGSYQGEEYLWIVMEYCGGGSVADLMNVTDEPLEEYQIAYICKEALKGLSYLHSIFKVHRDIKGSNILLTEQGEVKLGDFGVDAQLTRTMSKRNTFIGTPHWMAPEVIQESRCDGKVGVWALGVSAIEIAEGLPPRSNVHPMRVLFMISIEPAPVLEDKEKWSLVFHAFIAKCLTKDPHIRPTASELLNVSYNIIHKFIEKCKTGASVMVPKLERAKENRVSMALEAENVASETIPGYGTLGPKVNEDFGDTVPSKPHHVPNGLPVVGGSVQADGSGEAGEGDFGTVIVRSGVDIDETAPQTPVLTAKKPSPSLAHGQSSSVAGVGEDFVSPWVTKKVGASTDTFRTVGSPTTKHTPEAIRNGGAVISGTTKNEDGSRKALDKIVRLLLTFTSINVNTINNQQETAMDIADKLNYGPPKSQITDSLIESGAKHARNINRIDEAMELKRTVSDIKHEVHSQLLQKEQTQRRVSGIAKELKKIHREAVQNTINSLTVVAVLFSSIAFLAIFNLPGQYTISGKQAGTANIAHTNAFRAFCLFNATSLFISLAVVVVQITLVVWDTRAQRQIVLVVNKLMWAAGISTCGAFCSIAFVVVEKGSSWMTVMVMGVPILVGTLISLCYFVFQQHFGGDSQRRIRRASGSKPFSWSI